MSTLTAIQSKLKKLEKKNNANNPKRLRSVVYMDKNRNIEWPDDLSTLNPGVLVAPKPLSPEEWQKQMQAHKAELEELEKDDV